MEPGNLQRLCGTPGARSGQARPQSKDSCPSYDDFRPGLTVRGEGVGWGEVAQVRHDACRWSLETCRGCAGPRGPIWPSATSIQGFLPELRRFQAGAGVRERGWVLVGVWWRKCDMMRVVGAWKPAEAVRDPRSPIWPSATSIQGFLPGLGRFEAGFEDRKSVV